MSINCNSYLSLTFYVHPSPGHNAKRYFLNRQEIKTKAERK